jgi:polyisoprenyl-phosphate glycosyltransferase
MPRVAAIIPALDEERTVGDVACAVKHCPLVNEVIVVSDGSRDGTVESAQRQGARVVALRDNQGKGGAIAAGLGVTEAEIILLLDGDLVGLTSEHISDLLRPVLTGTADVSIGQITRDFIQTLFPILSGQRALRRSVLEGVRELENTCFGIEAALNRYLKTTGLRSCTVPLGGLRHIPKQEKHGILRGYADKMKATWEIAKWSGLHVRSKI